MGLVMSRLVLHAYDDTARFEADVRSFLMANEAANCLPLGLLTGLHAGEWSEAFMATVTRGAETGEAIVLVAMRTPPYNLVLCAPAAVEALAPLADHVHAATGPSGLPGVLGPEAAASSFAALWSERSGTRAELRVAQRIYRCETVEPLDGVPGSLRAVTQADRPLIRAWLQGFHAEAMPGLPFDADEATERWLASASRSLWFWMDEDRPVSMVGALGPTPNGIRIAAVYTPPELRRRGYASAAVAGLTQRMLDEGRAFCTLFTDLSNPTSNKIYQQVGYRPVLDVPLYAFEAAPAHRSRVQRPLNGPPA